MIQFLYKKKDKFNSKLRRRKFKSKVTNKNVISNASYNRTISPFPWLWGLRVKHACRVKFKTFIGTQKALMVTKNKVQVRFNKYPNFFVTKKSSKSRMGKGKGKIVGRILKVHKGETIFNIRFRNFFKCGRWLKAIKGTVPSKSSLINSSWGAKRFYQWFYKNRIRLRRRKHKRKRKKKPFWLKTVKRFRWKHELFDRPMTAKFRMRRFCRFLLGAWPLRRKKSQKKKNLWKFIDRYSFIYNRRKFRHNVLGGNNNSVRPRHLFPYSHSDVAGSFSRRLTRISGVFSSARKRSYYLRNDTMFHVLKNLRLDIFEPDADGFVGMAKFLNSYYAKDALKQRALLKRAVAQKVPGKF